MSLNDWRKNGWLQTHTPSREEIADLLARVSAPVEQEDAVRRRLEGYGMEL